MASALQGLLKQLSSKTANATPSALRTAASAVDLLEVLCVPGMNPAIATTLVGTASPENLRRNVAWSEHPPDPEVLAEVQAMLAPVQNATWPSGRPENS